MGRFLRPSRRHRGEHQCGARPADRGGGWKARPQRRHVRAEIGARLAASHSRVWRFFDALRHSSEQNRSGRPCLSTWWNSPPHSAHRLANSKGEAGGSPNRSASSGLTPSSGTQKFFIAANFAPIFLMLDRRSGSGRLWTFDLPPVAVLPRVLSVIGAAFRRSDAGSAAVQGSTGVRCHGAASRPLSPRPRSLA